jgi:hypothetical protein
MSVWVAYFGNICLFSYKTFTKITLWKEAYRKTLSFYNFSGSLSIFISFEIILTVNF